MPFPAVTVPTLVIWGMKDKALLPVQLDGLDVMVDDLTHRDGRGCRPFRALGAARAGDRGDPRFHAKRAAAAFTLRPGAATARPMAKPNARSRSRSRSAARLAAVQALYQQEMEETPVPTLLHEFHHHRLGATIDEVEYADAEVDFFDDLVKGVDARAEELDGLIAAKLAEGWSLERLDKPMRQILRAGAYELVARADVPVGDVISRICRRRQGLLRQARDRLRQRPARRHRQGRAPLAIRQLAARLDAYPPA